MTYKEQQTGFKRSITIEFDQTDKRHLKLTPSQYEHLVKCEASERVSDKIMALYIMQKALEVYGK